MVAISALVVALLGGGVAIAAVVYDGGRDHTLANGLRIGGVPVGGMTLDAARTKVVRTSVAPLRRTLAVKAEGHTFHLTAGKARVKVDVQSALDEALDASRQGWLGARVIRGLTGGKVDRDIALRTTMSSAALARFTHRVRDTVDRDPVSASVTPHASGLTIKHSKTGREVDELALRRKVRHTLKDPAAPTTLTASVKTLLPKTTSAELTKKYAAYIIVDRSSHVLRLYEHLKLARTFPIAVGMQGLETPTGLYDVQWKQKNPSWYVPDSPWAGDLAGKTIPPGPDDPIKARWLGFNGGAGIHGIDPSEYGSIGHDASHGCVRMRIPDVIVVYDAAPVGTPVYVT